MIDKRLFALAGALVLAGCADTPAPALAPTLTPTEQAEARLAIVPAVPAGAPLDGDALTALVQGGPYALTNYSLGIAATSNWLLDEGRAFGTFRVVETGDSGEWEIQAFVRDDQLCTVQTVGEVCHDIYPFEDGFMEVKADGSVHAVTLPM
jgi:hypothetical protein